MPSLNPLAFTDELSAVNRLLSAVGEAPISDLEESEREDVALAVTLLRETAMEVQSRGWRFNREFGYALHSVATFTPVGSTETLNIFTPPSNALRAPLTQNYTQARVDAVVRPPREYVSEVPVFYDRAKNRDGFADRTVLYIDPVWYFEFHQLPEVARRYIVVRTARQFIAQHIGASELVGFSISDEVNALQALEQAEGDEDEYNIFDSVDVSRIYQGRKPLPSGVSDPRINT